MKKNNSRIVENTIKEIIFKFLNPREYKAFIFGSQVTGRAKKFSDYDVGILGKKPLSLDKLALMEESFEESNLPFRVEIVDFSLVLPQFRKVALSKIKEL